MRPKPVDGSSGDHIDLAAPQRLNHCQRYFFGFSFESRDWSAGICRLAGRKYGQSSRALGPRATVSIILYIQAMTRIRAREAVVAEFLRKALAGELLSVPKLDAMARAAGLLDEGQRITNAKVFRRAKDALGIRSVRKGFGRGGGWAWKLSPSSDAPATIAATTQERSALPAISREWVQGVARLGQHRPPADIPRHRWTQFVEDCHAFLRSEALVHRAAQLGWRTIELFGCKPNYPLSYLGEAGLLWHVHGGRIVQLRRDWAVIDLQVNRSQRIFSRREIDQQKITLPWHLRPRR